MLQSHLNVQGHTIYYQVWGSGTPVILIHGFAADSTIWHTQATALAAYCKVIIPDLPGSGLSPFIDGATIDTYSAIIYAIAQQEATLPSQKICVIGHSMGGYIALAFAKKHADIINGLGLFHSTAYADTDEKKLARQKAIDFIQNNGAFAFLKEAIPANFSIGYSAIHIDAITALVLQADYFTDDTIIQYYKNMMHRPDSTHVLQQCPYPVLFVMGEHDVAVPIKSMLQQCHLPNTANVHILQHTAHMGMWEEADKANELLINFICNQC
jgi:pimeloyl-ACP methyl ester carboxylesterase